MPAFLGDRPVKPYVKIPTPPLLRFLEGLLFEVVLKFMIIGLCG
jgi:hypothetical protein